MMIMMIMMVCSSLSLSREPSGSVEGLFYFWSDQAEECNPCTVCPQVGRGHKHDDGVHAVLTAHSVGWWWWWRWWWVWWRWRWIWWWWRWWWWHISSERCSRALTLLTVNAWQRWWALWSLRIPNLDFACLVLKACLVFSVKEWQRLMLKEDKNFIFDSLQNDLNNGPPASTGEDQETGVVR